MTLENSDDHDVFQHSSHREYFPVLGRYALRFCVRCYNTTLVRGSI